MTSYRLDFPADVTPEAIADVLRVAATEPRGSLSATPVPIVFETILQPRSISWWLTLPPRRIKSVRAAAQRALPGLVWTKAERPSFEATRAIELRLRSGDRLLATDLAEQTVARLLTLSGELRKGEALLIQWAGGVVAAASANTTSLGSPAPHHLESAGLGPA